MKELIIIGYCLILSIALHANETKDTLRVAYTRAAPFIITDGGELEGISIWLWQRIASELEVEYELIEMGFRDMLDGLKDGKVDLSINPLTVTSERSKRMNFTYPFFASNATVAIKEATFFRQFVQFWRTFLSLSFLSGIIGWIFIIFLFGFVIWLFERKKNPEHFRKGSAGIWDGLWWSVVTMTTVGYGDKSPKSNGGKMVALIWMFSGLLFISGLTASVASSLTINQLSWNSKSITDFKDSKSGTI
ncbi:MAG: transporter substrate-binding domain-containing protein, partial [Bacteroidota bacterium]